MAEKSSKRARYSPESVESLIGSLERLKVSNPKAVNFQDHTYAPVGQLDLASTSEDGMHDNCLAGTSSEEGRRYIRSWKMSEHLYRRKDCPFPTLARGLFTATEEYALPSVAASLKGKEKVRIVARGYDKFFNEGEVEWTEWKHLQRHSLPPYDLTYKSNGCLILISALSPKELMVSSKHSLGTTTVQKEETGINGAAGDSRDGRLKPELGPKSGEHTAVETAPNSVEDMNIMQDDTAPALTASQEATTSKNALKKLQKAERAKAKHEADKIAKAAKEEEAAKRKEEVKNGREADDMVPHAEMGRRWVKTTLDKAGRTEEDLAAVLWERNLTAVTELCDDSFEEHVLPTPEHLTGLHLHGLNLNTPHFATLDPSVVADFAKQWGFIETPSVQLQTLDEVREYTDRVSKEGTWNGEAIEGFVVRCLVKEVQSSSSVRDDGEPPYPPGSPFFFKIKFEEPYLMYRQWREITRQLMPLLRPECKGRTDRKAFPWTQMGAKLKRPESAVYADWCAERMVNDPHLFDHYDKGVVKVRERFLEWTQSDGRPKWEVARGSQGASNGSGSKKVKTMIVPVAAPGCGKTLLGLTLSRLFGFAHTQSDDVTTKRTAAGFLKNIETLFKTNDVVYCDRNNHLPKHHEELSNLAKSLSNDQIHIRPIALVWDVDSVPFNRALRITSERVLGRGDNHQSLRPDRHDQMRHELVIKQFLNEFVPPEGGLFEQTIKLGLEKSFEENLKLAIKGLKEPLGLEIPSDELIREATESISGYQPTVKKEAQGRKTAEPRYYGLSLEMNLQERVQQIISTAQAGLEENIICAQTFLDGLVADARVIGKPHITIVHEKSVAAEKETGEEGPQTRLWDTCASFRELPSPPRFNFDLVALLWNDRIMTLVVDNVQPHDRAEGSEKDSKANEVEKVLCSELKEVLHVTVGTRDESIPPFEARALVETWRKERGSEEKSVRQLGINDVRESGRVLGMS